jgi:hypothetical protein
MELEIAIFNIMAKTGISPEEVEKLTVSELLEISKNIRIKEGEAKGYERLDKQKVVLNKQNIDLNKLISSKEIINAFFKMMDELRKKRKE